MCIKCFFVILIPASLPMPLTSIKTLNWTNFEDWKESLDLYLAITNMDFSLREAEPSALTPESTIVQRASREKWEHSNRMCLMVMRYTMEKSIRQSIPDNDNAKDFMRSVGEKFKTFDKAQKGQYLSLLEKTKYDGVSGVREHMMKLVHYYNKLKSLKVDLGDSYLIWQVMESLPSQFDVLKTSYNTQKEEWTIDEMIAIISQEEASIKNIKSHSVQFTTTTSSTKPMKKGFKGKSRPEKGNTWKASVVLEPKKKYFKGICAYCKKFGHKLAYCYILKKKNADKEGILLYALACFESNVIDVPPNSWWLDSGATIHVVNSL